MRACIVAFVVVGLCSVAQAGAPIAIESHSAPRSDDVRALVEPVLAELGTRGYRVGAGRVGNDAERISRPSSAGNLDLREISTRAQDGINKWHSGAVDEAADVLQRLWVDARLNPAPIALNSAAREPLFRALVTLAMVRARVKAAESAFDVMAEVIRTYPDQVVTRAAFGPEAAKLFESTRQTLNQQGRGTLTVKVGDPAVQVFVNERYAANGTTTRPDLVPGHYRVYLQRGNVEGRFYIVKVEANAEAVLEVTWPFDVALHSGPYWAGFQFSTEADRLKAEATFAAELARKLDAPVVIVLAVGKLKGKHALIGTTYEVATGAARRSASIAVTPPPSDERLRAFAGFLVGDTASGGFDVVDAAAAPAPARDTSRRPPSWVKWTLGGAGVASLAAGAYLLSIHGDGRCAAPELGCVEQWDTAAGGGVLLGVGAVAVVGGAYLYLRERKRGDRAVAIVPRGSGVSVSASWAF